jgi:hypothetical protein
LYKHMETELYTFERSVICGRNEGGNQKIPRNQRSENTAY